MPKFIFWKDENSIGELREDQANPEPWPTLSWMYYPHVDMWYRTANNSDGTPPGWHWCDPHSKYFGQFKEISGLYEPPTHIKLQALLLKGTL